MASFSEKKVNGKGAEAPSKPAAPLSAESAAAESREADGIYQVDRQQRYQLVARVRDPEIDEEGKEVRFGEIYQSDDLLLPDECEFRKFILMVRRIAYATKVTRDSPQKGRILRGVVAEIVGYREN